MLEIFDFHYENLSVGSRFKQLIMLPIQPKWIPLFSQNVKYDILPEASTETTNFYFLRYCSELLSDCTKSLVYEKLKPAKTETTVELAITIFHTVQLALFN